MESLTLHETISFYRKQQNLTQEALAQQLGVSNQSVSKWESAQCYPDISLIPQLAEIFGISIDELFGKEPANSGLNNIFSLREDVFRVVVVRGQQIIDSKNLDETIHIEYPQHASGDRQCYKVEVFGNITCQGNICGDIECQGSVQSNIISGDISCHGNIECSQINGDAATFGGTISCNGNIGGDVRTYPNGSIPCGDISCGNIAGDVNCDGNIECKSIEGNAECQGNLSCGGSIEGNAECQENLSCGGSIEGNVICGNNISCAGSINGTVNCGDNIACGDNIIGDVSCGGSVECKTIEGNVECQGNIIYK